MAPARPRKALHSLAPNSPAPRSFNSSKLVRLLADLTPAELPDSKQSLVERLGLWLGWADAIALSSVVAGSLARAPDGPDGQPFQGDGAAEALARLRTTLALAITTDPTLSPGDLKRKVNATRIEAAMVDGSDFAPLRRRYLAHQRAMEAAIGPVRGRIRASLQQLSPEVARLASLDAVLEQALAERENHLLASVPARLEKRFAALRKAHAAAQAPAPELAPAASMAPASDPTPAPVPAALPAPLPAPMPVPEHAISTAAPAAMAQPAPPAWFAGFRLDLQAVLLAELAVRLQPLEGLVEALDAARHPVRTEEMTGQR